MGQAHRLAECRGWRAWYGDGALYDSRLTTWERLPRRGLVILMLYEHGECAPGEAYRRAVEGHDYVMLTPDGEIRAEDEGSAADWDVLYGEARVKIGQLLPDAAWQRLEAEAMGARRW